MALGVISPPGSATSCDHSRSTYCTACFLQMQDHNFHIILIYKVVQIWPGLICVITSRTAQQLCDLERVKPQPPPYLLLGLEPVQSCLGVARVTSNYGYKKKISPGQIWTTLYFQQDATLHSLFSSIIHPRCCRPLAGNIVGALYHKL